MVSYLGVEGLLDKLGDGQGAVLLRATRRERRESDHKKVETRERNHVHGQLAQIAIQLTGEANTARRTGDGGGDQMVQITVGGRGQLERAEADVVQSFVVQTEGLIGVLDKLMHGQDAIVRLNDGIGDLGGRDDGIGGHDAIGILLTDLGDQKRTETAAGTTAHGMRHSTN